MRQNKRFVAFHTIFMLLRVLKILVKKLMALTTEDTEDTEEKFMVLVPGQDDAPLVQGISGRLSS